ncbi:hypothetical protein D3C79_541930 [compost metagenome]
MQETLDTSHGMVPDPLAKKQASVRLVHIGDMAQSGKFIDAQRHHTDIDISHQCMVIHRRCFLFIR